MQRTVCGRRASSLVLAARRRRDALGHVAGRDERRVVDVDARAVSGRQRRRLARGARRDPASSPGRAHARSDSCSSQSPPTLRRNRVRPSTPPSLVKLAARRLVGEDGRVELEPDERPRAARDVGEVGAFARDADDGRRGVVRADRGDDDGRGARPSRSRDARVEHGVRGPRPAARSAGAGRGDAEAVEQLASTSVPVRTSTRPVVDAFVASVRSSPVSQ